MKTLLTLTLALVAGLMLPACQGVFSKQDAVELGTGLAAKSLVLAQRKWASEKIDLQAEAKKLGFELASEAATRIALNVSASSTTATAAPGAPVALVLASQAAATQSLEREVLVPDAVAELAGVIAGIAAEDAKAVIKKAEADPSTP